MTDFAAFRELGVATVYEAAGKHGLIELDLVRVIPGSRACGPARTVVCGQDDNLMVHACIERIEPGDVVVLTMPQPEPVALIGDQLMTQMRKRGVAGVLVDAAVRDVDDLVALGVPVWARWIRAHGPTKQRLGRLDVPVMVGWTRIAPGDVVLLDGDGACAISRERASEVLAAARERAEGERAARERYEGGELSVDVHALRPVLAELR